MPMETDGAEISKLTQELDFAYASGAQALDLAYANGAQEPDLVHEIGKRIDMMRQLRYKDEQLLKLGGS